MYKRNFLELTSFLGISCIANPVSLFSQEAIKKYPNIVYILADDLGYGDLSCQNPNSKIPTPYIDQLASEGIRFTDAHSPSSVCSPTRYSILTGRYCWRSRLKRGVLGMWDKPLIEQDRFTVQAMLKKVGYHTACIGKWHLGWNWPTKDGNPPSNGDDRLSNVDFTKPIADGPLTKGFNYYFGTDVPNYPPYCFIENDRTVGIPNEPNRPEFNRPGPMLSGWQWVNIMPELTKKSVKYIEERSKDITQRPFFLYFPLTAPHYPVVPAVEFKGKSQAGEYGDFVTQVDWTVGQVMDALKRNGLEDNTLVIFTSDNGPEITGEVNPGAYDRIREFDHYSMGEFRGAKRDIWEGGHRVPFIAKWHNKIKPNSISDETICLSDFMSTAAAIVDYELPANAGEDSYNILPALLGENHEPIREATVHHSGIGNFAIRKDNWVLIDSPSGGDNKEPEWYKGLREYDSNEFSGELYDLSMDHGERRNLYNELPDKVKELKELIEKYKRDGRSVPK